MKSMKNSIYLIIFAVFLCIGCNKNEMKISRSDSSVITEITDFSPVYITKDLTGKVAYNKNNLIGNTHWIISADRDLTLSEITFYLNELTLKKYKKDAMHPDSKQMFFVYSDTFHKQNAFVELPFTAVFAGVPEKNEQLTDANHLYKITNVKDFKEQLLKITSVEGHYGKIFISFSKEMSVEDFVNVLIEIQKQELNNLLIPEMYIY